MSIGGELNGVVLVALMTAFCLTSLFCVFLNYKLKSMRAVLQRMEKGLSIANSGAVGMGQRMLELEAKLIELKQKQNDHTEADDDSAYTRARELMRRGLPDEVISASCGISVSEVNLMRLIQGQHDFESQGV
jgi:ArsR family metal-binding transcriptional regulator